MIHNPYLVLNHLAPFQSEIEKRSTIWKQFSLQTNNIFHEKRIIKSIKIPDRRVHQKTFKNKSNDWMIQRKSWVLSVFLFSKTNKLFWKITFSLCLGIWIDAWYDL